MAAGVVACLGVAAPAEACVVVPYSSAQAFARADVVFVGTAVSQTPAVPIPPGDPFPFKWTFSVDRTYKGPASEFAEIASTPPGVILSCGERYEAGKKYTVYANRMDGRLMTSLGSPVDLGTIAPPTAQSPLIGEAGAALRAVCRSRRVARSAALDSRRLRKEAVNDPALRYFDRHFQGMRLTVETRRLLALLRHDNAAIDAHLRARDRGLEPPNGAVDLGSATDRTDLAVEIHLAALGGPDCTGEPPAVTSPRTLRARIARVVARYEAAAVRLSSRPEVMRRRARALEQDVRRLEAALLAVKRTATTTPAKRRWKADTLRLGGPVAHTLRGAIFPARKGDVAAIARVRAELDASGPPFARLLTAAP